MRLKLNASKTELIWFNRLLTPATDIPHTVLNLGPDCFIKPSDVVRDFGVLLDNTLSLKCQIASITKSCFFHLRGIRQVKKSLNENCLRTLVQALVSSLDLIIATRSFMASPHPPSKHLPLFSSVLQSSSKICHLVIMSPRPFLNYIGFPYPLE